MSAINSNSASDLTQNVPDIHVIGKRLIAFLIDTAVLSSMAQPAQAFFSSSASATKYIFIGRFFISFSFFSLYTTLFSLTFFFLQEAFFGRTIGKKLMGLRVVNLEGRHLSWQEALKRNLLRIVDNWLIGLIAISYSPLNQRLGDRLAHTLVVSADSVPPHDYAPKQRERGIMLLTVLFFLEIVGGMVVTYIKYPW